MERLLRDVFLSAQLHDVLAAAGIPQNADLFLCRVAFAFHALGPFQVTLANTSSGSVSGGHVRGPDTDK